MLLYFEEIYAIFPMNKNKSFVIELEPKMLRVCDGTLRTQQIIELTNFAV